MPAVRKPGSGWAELPRAGERQAPNPAGRARLGYASASTADSPSTPPGPAAKANDDQTPASAR
jgi:hypothetical protein